MDKVKSSKKLIRDISEIESKKSVISKKDIKKLNRALKKLGIFIFYYERRGGA